MTYIATNGSSQVVIKHFGSMVITSTDRVKGGDKYALLSPAGQGSADLNEPVQTHKALIKKAFCLHQNLAAPAPEPSSKEARLHFRASPNNKASLRTT
jgi:hypothetical protein